MTFLRVFRGEIVTESVIRGEQGRERTEAYRFMTVRVVYTTAAGAAGSGVAEPRRTEAIVDYSRATAWVVTRDAKSELFTPRAT